jgi:hypothetical protein
MKALFQVLIKLMIFLVLVQLYACNNDFLHVEPKVGEAVQDTIVITDKVHDVTIDFNLPLAGNAKWKIFQFPSWLEISPVEGEFNNGKSSFSLKVINHLVLEQIGAFSFPLIFDVDGLGLVQYPFFLVNFGNAFIQFSTQNIDLAYGSKSEFTILNYGTGALTWEIIEKPVWASFLNLKGVLNPDMTDTVKFDILRENLPNGDYSGEIKINTNAPEGIYTVKLSMKVADPTFSGKVTALEGEVIDCDFCKNSSTCVFITKYPNRIYSYTTGGKLNYIDLNTVPLNVAISENGDQIAITSSNTELTLIDPENMTIKNVIQSGVISTRLVLGNNGWAYIAPKPYTTNHLISIDLASEDVYVHQKDLNGLTRLMKVPGKNILCGEKVGYSPDNLFVFDISNGKLNEEFDEYSMEIYPFWFSESGERIFTQLRKVYKTPEYLNVGFIWGTPVLNGELEEIPGTITSIAQSEILKEIFVVTGGHWQGNARILRFDDKGLFKKGEIFVNECQYFDNGILVKMDAMVPYMYVDKSGKELVLIKKGTDIEYLDHWYFEKLSLDN